MLLEEEPLSEEVSPFMRLCTVCESIASSMHVDSRLLVPDAAWPSVSGQNGADASSINLGKDLVPVESAWELKNLRIRDEQINCS